MTFWPFFLSDEQLKIQTNLDDERKGKLEYRRQLVISIDYCNLLANVWRLCCMLF